jgi:hypothetical protein
LAQNTAAATVAAAPTTAEEINAVVNPLVDSAAGALEKAGMGFLEGAAGVVGFIFASSEQAGGEKPGDKKNLGTDGTFTGFSET